MSAKPRFVFDTSVLVSAVLFEQSVPGQALYAALDRGDLLVSEATVRELSAVLGRQKFDRYLTKSERDQFMNLLLREATLVEIIETIRACRDSNDDVFLEVAVNGNATSIITGDQDLLDLHPFRGISIRTPRQFLETLASADSNNGAS